MGAPAHVRAAIRTTLTDAERSADQLVAGLARATETSVTAVLERYAKTKHHKNIHELLVIFHAPWVRSHTSRAQATLKTEMRVTAGMIEQLVGRALLEKTPLDEAGTFERSVVRVELNGYPTADPEGKSASQIGVVVLRSDVDQVLLHAITEVLGRSAPGREPRFRSVTFAFMSVLKVYAREASSYTIADMTSEATSFFPVHRGVVEQFVTIPVGSRSIIRSIAELQKITPEAARSSLRMLFADTGADASQHSSSAALEAAEAAIIKEFGKGLSTLSTERRLPYTLVSMANPDIAQWFAQFLSKIDFGQFTVTGKPFEVQSLTAEQLRRQVVFDPETTSDTGIALCGAFVGLGANPRPENL
jgi:cell division ATPase FtsA